MEPREQRKQRLSLHVPGKSRSFTNSSQHPFQHWVLQSDVKHAAPFTSPGSLVAHLAKSWGRASPPLLFNQVTQRLLTPITEKKERKKEKEEEEARMGCAPSRLFVGPAMSCGSELTQYCIKILCAVFRSLYGTA